VPGETPRDPVVAAAEGERAGEPWRLVVYRSTYRPGGGRPAVADVCYILDWFAMDEGPPLWQAHGTCSPETQAASVLAAGAVGTSRDEVAVIGRAPATASRVRLELSGRAPVEARTVAAPGVPGRFYAVFVPKASHLRRMVALDRAGRAVGTEQGQGDLDRQLGGYPPTGPVTVVATTHDRFAGRLELVAWPIRDGFCLAQWGSSGCGARALEPDLHCSSSRVQGQATIRLHLAVGGVPRTARTVLVEVGGKRVRAPTRDGGALFDRSFFAANVPRGTLLRGTVRVTAFDAGGTRVGSWTLQGCD
jgi:hypothetical protein